MGLAKRRTEADADDRHTQISNANLCEIAHGRHPHWPSHEHRQIKKDVAGDESHAQQKAFVKECGSNFAEIKQRKTDRAQRQHYAHQYLERVFILLFQPKQTDGSPKHHDPG